MTIDWTALSAAFLLLGVAFLYAVFGIGAFEITDAVSEEMKDAILPQ